MNCNLRSKESPGRLLPKLIVGISDMLGYKLLCLFGRFAWLRTFSSSSFLCYLNFSWWGLPVFYTLFRKRVCFIQKLFISLLVLPQRMHIQASVEDVLFKQLLNDSAIELAYVLSHLPS